MRSSRRDYRKEKGRFEFIVSRTNAPSGHEAPAAYELTLKQLGTRGAGVLFELKPERSRHGCRHDLSGIRVKQRHLVLPELGRNPASGS
jgi:hypothetical protein